MKCVICKHGITSNGTTTITLEREGATIVFKNVPAQICENCGEAYIDDEISSKLLFEAENIISGGAEVDIRNFQSVAA